MKKVTVIGVGTGAETLTPEAREAITKTEVLFGSPGLLEIHKDDSKATYPNYLPDEVAGIIESEQAKSFAVLVSGDVGFYSAAAGLGKVLCGYELSFIPGISTVNAFFAKLRLSWHGAAFVSMHGRDTNIVDVVRRNELTFCLTGNNVKEIGTALTKAGLGHIKTFIGENLGLNDERIYETDAEKIKNGEYPSLTVLLFKNEAYEDRVRFGLPDSLFSRTTGIPMTKSETRAVVTSKLELRPSDICWDIGAGTGSITVEMALAAYRGYVYAVERNAEAKELIEKNITAFHLGNVSVIIGKAPAVLEALPAPDVVFIGGSSGQIEEIMTAALIKNPGARIVITAVTLETVSAVVNALNKTGSEFETVQLNVAKSRKAGELHMMEAQNPVTIFTIMDGGA